MHIIISSRSQNSQFDLLWYDGVTIYILFHNSQKVRMKNEKIEPIQCGFPAAF